MIRKKGFLSRENLDISIYRDINIGSQLPVDIRKDATILFRSFLIDFKCEV